MMFDYVCDFVTADQGSPDAFMMSWKEGEDEPERICDLLCHPNGVYRLRVAEISGDFLEEPVEYTHKSALPRLKGKEKSRPRDLTEVDYFMELVARGGSELLLEVWGNKPSTSYAVEPSRHVTWEDPFQTRERKPLR